MTDRRRTYSARRAGFTLIELLVVITIVILVSAVAITAVPGLAGNYQVTEGARFLMATLGGARDRAIRANEPRGVRLLPDPNVGAFIPPGGTGFVYGSILAANRIIDIEPAPDIVDPTELGSATFASEWNPATGWPGAMWTQGAPPPLPVQYPTTTPFSFGYWPYPYDLAPASVGPPPTWAVGGTVRQRQVLLIVQDIFKPGTGSTIYNPPTNWFWNVRVGDKVRLGNSGSVYTVVGPMTRSNPENFVNVDNAAGVQTHTITETYATASGTITATPEYLFLVNGVDDNGNGFVDEAFDGIDENLDGSVDNYAEFGAYGIATTGEFENSFIRTPPPFRWTISRRPVPVPGAKEVNLPGNTVVDLTTWDADLRAQALLANGCAAPTFPVPRERSRLPVDPNNGYVDIMVNQAGQVVPTTLYSSPASFSLTSSFYHFWITDRADLYATAAPKCGELYPLLPMPQDSPGYPTTGLPFLKKERQLVTLYTRTGQVISNSITSFQGGYATPTILPDAELPYRAAQNGLREAK